MYEIFRLQALLLLLVDAPFIVSVQAGWIFLGEEFR